MAEAVVEHRVRVRVFVDFWNFQLSLNKRSNAVRFEADWKVLGGVLAGVAAEVVDAGAQVVYQGMDVYGSYGEGDADARLRKWAENWLARQPGVHVEMQPRRASHPSPRCEQRPRLRGIDFHLRDVALRWRHRQSVRPQPLDVERNCIPDQAQRLLPILAGRNAAGQIGNERPVARFSLLQHHHVLHGFTSLCSVRRPGLRWTILRAMA